MELRQEPAFGALLRSHRRNKGWTQQALAERAGLSADAISALERGTRRTPWPDTVDRLVDALELSEAERDELCGSMRLARSVATNLILLPTGRAEPLLGRPPGSTTSFIGRERDSDVVAAMLRSPSPRLVTLLGPGGVGKTRLALAVASLLEDHFVDGIAFIPLAQLTDPAYVPSAIADVLGVHETSSRPLVQTLIATLSTRHKLLALDNFEHLPEAAAVVSDLLNGCNRLMVLITSRTPLHIYAEQRFPVSPLAVPEGPSFTDLDRLAANESVRLFVDRARAVDPAFTLTSGNAADVTEICVQLEGLPLALELAAARLALFPLPVLSQRLTHRLDTLVSGPLDVPERQQTLRDTIAWSYDLLGDAERRVFACFSVFAGGCELKDLDAVVSASGDEPVDVQGAVRALVESQLLLLDTDVSSGEPRYRMLEIVREYASEHLERSADAARVKDAHAARYLALAERLNPRRPLFLEDALERLDGDHDNLRAALAWLLDSGDAVRALRLACALEWFWFQRSHWTEGRRWLEN
ncbi:MAG TPA: helix-turn-helix domain-containing protein, partial [Candidatus Sulfotelmatobacter sp.]|nr:helix-turn-helix domain-containing protein [Candidatus Sulfotelmatobacter sp.]